MYSLTSAGASRIAASASRKRFSEADLVVSYFRSECIAPATVEFPSKGNPPWEK